MARSRSEVSEKLLCKLPEIHPNPRRNAEDGFRKASWSEASRQLPPALKSERRDMQTSQRLTASKLGPKAYTLVLKFGDVVRALDRCPVLKRVSWRVF